MDIIQVPAHTNNYGIGRNGKTPNKVIVHWIVGTLASADATFQNPLRRASAHYGIEDSKVHQYVKESDTAWHASNLTINRESVGIEHSGGELLGDGSRRKPSEGTHQTSGKLISQICKRYNIPIDREHILPHNKFSSTQCPGTLNLDRLIEIAKSDSGTIIQPMEPISDDKSKIDFKGYQTSEEAYNIVELGALKSMLLAKDKFITEHKNIVPPTTPPTVPPVATAPLFTDPVARHLYRQAIQAEAWSKL